ncbi:toprim domain-containing protein [Mucilaginibacter sp. HMF5004]|uniref:toprim domain-containing protein n=1 Tax=Mucilaginibacter rivuli TaxID=2857527 RepID=UPI001C5ED182|nr:toprim domain-containing protein [Mucilaginibacter rivuli]MBW4889208.1 toprim domain-containing protein [Mucilaginibacter rivuli]
MNIEQAKTVPITDFLHNLKFKPTKETTTDAIYLSPIREEKTPSFHVDKIDNVWYDHGLKKGGKIIALAIEILKYKGYEHAASDALRYINNMIFDPYKFVPAQEVKPKKSKWKIIRTEALEDLALIRYLKQRGIPFNVAKKHLLEVYITHTETRKGLYALGFKNEDGGYELRNPFFKSSIKPKSITFIRGKKSKPDGVHLFEGFMDYLTFLVTRNGQGHDDDVIVLNSVTNVPNAISYIRNYGYKIAYTWMDNDVAGERATLSLAEFFKTEQDLTHKKMNDVYRPYKDVNAWHMYNLNLTV